MRPWHTGAVLLLTLAAGTVTCGAGRAETALPPPIVTMLRDLDAHFWDGGRGRIHPTNGCNKGQSGCFASSGGVGEINRKLGELSFWEMAQYANLQAWQYRVELRAGDVAGAAATKAKIAAQWAAIHKRWSDADLASASPRTGIMNVSDDAFWALDYLVQVNAILDDDRALDAAARLLPRILDRWADPHAPRVDYGGGLRGSRYGLLYAEPSGDPDHQGVSGIFEAMMGLDALAIHAKTGDGPMLAFARDVYARTRHSFRQPATGVYYTELDIKPCTASGEGPPCGAGGPNPHYLKPVSDYFGAPQRGCDATYLAGTMAMALLAVRLADVVTEEAPAYHADAKAAAAGIARRDTYLRPGDLIVNSRDPWTDGYFAPAFAAEVLSRPGMDPNGQIARAMANTGHAITASRTAGGLYGADWTPPEPNGCVKTATSWSQQARIVNGGSGGGQALPSQIMTAGSSGAMALGGFIAETLPR